MNNKQTNSTNTVPNLWERSLSNAQHIEPKERSDEAKIEVQRDWP